MWLPLLKNSELIEQKCFLQSAISLALINTTDVKRKGNGFRQAQRHLRAESMRFHTGSSSPEKLVAAFADAEAMIGDVNFDPKKLSED